MGVQPKNWQNITKKKKKIKEEKEERTTAVHCRKGVQAKTGRKYCQEEEEGGVPSKPVPCQRGAPQT